MFMDENEVIENEQTTQEIDSSESVQEGTKGTNTHIQFIVVALIVALLGLSFVFIVSKNNKVNEVPEANKAVESSVTTTTQLEGKELYIKVIEDDEIGNYLADRIDNRTLYVIDEENCPIQCMTQWLSYNADKDVNDQELSTEMLSENTHQLTWNDERLYHFVQDENPEDTLGDGYFFVGNIARP
jgi:predicted lipoprotein with Yx(FWY)xxD motif